MSNVVSPEVVIVRSKLFSRFPKLVFGMSTRSGGVSPEPLLMNLSFSVGDDPKNVKMNRSRFFGTLGITEDRLALPRQIHSNVVREITEPGLYPDCDALITNTHNLFPGVSVADCVPVFLYDPLTSTVAAVHSGWKGSKSRILENVIKALVAEQGVNAANVVAFIGPSASVCCYEVGEEVASAFGETFVQRWPNKKPHLDLKQFNKQLMIDNGVEEENIEVSNDCTIRNHLYHSFRRDGNRSGRMYGIIGMLNPPSR